MLNFFEMIWEYIQIAFNFVLTLITSLINAITTLVTSIPLLFTLSGFMPFFITSSMMIAIAIVIINYIIGRSNQ